MSQDIFQENIKIEIILTDLLNNSSIKGEITTELLKEMYEKYNIDGIKLIFSKLYNELTQQNSE